MKSVSYTHLVADILSRYPADAKPDEVNDDTHEYLINHLIIKMNYNVGKIIKDIGRHQLDDDKLRIIIDKIKDKNLDHKLSKFYKYVSNKLYRRQRDEWKLYVPNNVSNNLIAEIHRMYGHLGPKRCIKMLQEHFTFDRMLKKVKEMCIRDRCKPS